MGKSRQKIGAYQGWKTYHGGKNEGKFEAVKEIGAGKLFNIILKSHKRYRFSPNISQSKGIDNGFGKRKKDKNSEYDHAGKDKEVRSGV
jgi:hypothetical protein